MKMIICSFLILFFTLQVKATSYANPATTNLINCGINLIRVWDPRYGYACVPRYNTPTTDCFYCQMQNPQHSPYNNYNWFNQFPPAIYQPVQQPWWATQGNFYYPNLHYPGAWSNHGYNPGINPSYYHGEGQVFAAKPNVYVESIHKNKKFSFAFTSKDKIHLLATTPILDENKTWKGKIVNGDRFEIEDVNYDYLFYDLRLPKDKMQFEHGLCATRSDAIAWMLKDLKEMQYPAIAVADFEEHWMVKIPDYPYYCIYPQYNNQLDPAIPTSISIPDTKFTRSLYVLVPHRKAPDAEESQNIPLPKNDSSSLRTIPTFKHETMFKEWGVAFLGE
jgi:hypothetical protein